MKGQLLSRVVRLKSIGLSILPPVFGVLAILAIYQTTLDARLLSHNERLGFEMGRLNSLRHHNQVETERMKDEIDRLRFHKEEELFHARLRLGMLNSGEVVYQFPHGRDDRRRLEEPAQ